MNRRQRTLKRLGGVILWSVVFLMPGCFLTGYARAQDLEAETVKAAFVLNFARFAQWPETAFSGPTAPINLWVFGGTATRRAFGTLDGKRVGTRSIQVRFMNSAKSADTCHIMFISRDVAPSVRSGALAVAGHRPVLTIGEVPEFIRLGGVINLFNRKGRFHFEINPEAARRKGLRLSSRLLKLAIIVGTP